MKLLIYGWSEWENLIIKAFPHHDINTINNKNYDDYDIVIPLIEESIKECINNKIFDKSLICNYIDTIDLCQDKIKFQNFMDLHFPDLMPKIVPNNKYPFILKKRIDEGGKNTFIINDKEEYEMHNTKDHFCQEPIFGTEEYVTHIIFDKEIKFIKSIKYIYDEEIFIKGVRNPVKKAKILENNELEGTANKILEKLNFRGPCCFNYKKNNDKIYIFELNARFGGSAMKSLTKEIMQTYIDLITKKN